MFTIYTTTHRVEEMDGRIFHNAQGPTFHDKRVVEEFFKSQPIMCTSSRRVWVNEPNGARYGDWKYTEIQVCETVSEAIREHALQKLTPEEKEVLGLTS